MRLNRIGALAALSLGMASTAAALDSIERDSLPVPPKPKKPNKVAHTQSREIARRLRQEARKAAKARGEA